MQLNKGKKIASYNRQKDYDCAQENIVATPVTSDSLTKKGDAFTVKQILDRHAQGLLMQQKNPLYYADNSLDDDNIPRHLKEDFFDQAEKLYEIREELKVLQENNEKGSDNSIQNESGINPPQNPPEDTPVK